MFGSGFYDSYDEGRVDRSDWATKSVAATRREAEAMKLFDAFLDSCKGLAPNQFPVTEQVVGADIHLTNPCWLDFRKYVQSKGCTAKRREATLAERKATHDKQRNGKMYVISVTVPVHPSQAVAISKQKQEEAAAAAVERKVKAVEAQKRKEEEQSKHKEAVQQTYAKLTSSNPDKTVASSNLQVLAPVQTLEVLEHAEQVYQDQLRDIRKSVCMKEREVREKIEAKKRQLEAEALREYKRVKTIILDASPDDAITCSLCQKDFKIAAATCITKACKSSVCKECLRTKVKNEVKCVVCQSKWKTNEAVVQNFLCQPCLLQRGSYHQFDYCRRDCGFICPQHTHTQKCCVCGNQSFCSFCEIEQCGKCGANLCSRCSFKEGCMCDGMTGREILMRQLGEY